MESLIVSVLILRSLARLGRRRNLSLVVLATLGVYVPFAWFTIPSEVASRSGTILLQIAVVALVFLGALVAVGMLLTPGVRKEVFNADKQSADLVGHDTLLGALLKLETLGEDHSGSKTMARKYRFPSIKERIENLKSPEYDS